MARPSPRPLSDLARTLRRRPRQGVAGVFQRVALAVLPAPAAAPSTAIAVVAPPPPALPAPEVTHLAARERARRALAEARQAMTGVLGDDARATDESADPIGEPLATDVERLRAYLEESDRERSALRREMEEIRSAIEDMRWRLDAVERSVSAPSDTSAGRQPESSETNGAAPATPSSESAIATASESAAPPPIPPPPADTSEPEGHIEDDQTVRDLRERVLRALRDRVFAAGTVGTRVAIEPPPSPDDLAAIIARFDGEPFVEHAEPIPADAGTAALRVTLRTPLRWEQFSGVLERALARPLAPGDVSWSHGAVRVRLAPVPAAGPADGSTPDAAPDGG